MLVAFFLFFVNGVVPMWVYKHLGPIACVVAILCSLILSAIVCVYASKGLEEYIESRDKEPRSNNTNNDSSGDIAFVFFPMFIGTIAAIVFAVAVPTGSITLMEFAIYTSIPALFLDIVYFAISLGAGADFVGAIANTILLGIIGWGLSLFAIALMALIYIVTMVGVAIAAIVLIIIVYIISWIFG